MNVNGRHYRTIWLKDSGPGVIQAIDQQALPFSFEVIDLAAVEDVVRAIKDMRVRGAGLIGAAAGYGMYLAALNADEAGFDETVLRAAAMLKAARPTASNLAWAVDRMLERIFGAASACGAADTAAAGGAAQGASQRRAVALAAAKAEACAIADQDAECCRAIGRHGLKIIEALAKNKPSGEAVNILTHCNAGWLAFVDYGSALSPVYAAFDAGLAVHVWVDETRPRNQGAALTAWELAEHGVPHHLLPDNAGGHLMQAGLVDMVITGADRVTAEGDAANKIGTYLKALAAKENRVPFYVALPSSTFDFSLRSGVGHIPIEERDPAEVRFVSGRAPDGSVQTVQVCPDATPARNWGFDVTPARYITGLITERGVCPATGEGILSLFPERRGDSNREFF
jgi:methylthioribose-1-phosphate isomerase